MINGQRICNFLIIIFFTVYCFLTYGYLLGSSLVSSEDLPAHISLSQALRQQLLSGNLVFYDTSSFSGWPAFAFYGFLWSLLVVLLSLPLTLLCPNPVILASNVLLWFCILLIPLCIYFTAKVLVASTYPNQETLLKRQRPILALFSTAFSLWFLQHDGQFFGIGAGAYLVVGLAPQLLAHLLLILLFAQILKLINQDSVSNRIKLALLCCLLLWTHLLTAAYFLFFCAVLSLFWISSLRRIWESIALGFAAAAIWLLPAVWHVSRFTLPDPYPAQGDFLTILFRYPVQQILYDLRHAPMHLLSEIQFFPFLFAGLLIACCFHQELRRSKILLCALFSIILCVFILSSGYLASSLPLAFHYYRFHSYSAIMLLPILAAAATICTVKREPRTRSISQRPVATLVLAGFALLASISVIRLPSLEILQAGLSSRVGSTEVLNKVLAFIDNSELNGRIFVEYGNDYQRLPYLSSHYLDAMIPQKTQREVLGGLFVESGLRYRFAAVPASLLGANVFAPYLIFTKNYQGDSRFLLSRLHLLGVDTIVASSPKFIRELESISPASKKIGHFSIFEYSGRSAPPIRQARPIQIGYYDPLKLIPFKLLSFYLSARGELFSDVELVEIIDLKQIPDSLNYLLTTQPKKAGRHSKAKILPLSGSHSRLSHYAPDYSLVPSVGSYRKLATVFDNNLETWKTLLSPSKKQSHLKPDLLDETEKISHIAPTETLQWTNQEQEFKLDNLRSGQLYSLNYSFTPFLRCLGCKLYRGGSNNILVQAESSTAQVQFRYFSDMISLLGCLITLLSWIGAIYILKTKGIGTS